MNRRVATVFIDALLLFLLVLVILPHKPEEARATPSVDLFAQLIIAARWPDGSTADVDLWVRAPGDSTVGYSHTRGRVSSLIWDDVGNVSYPKWRYEGVMVRRATDGEYVVNLHLFRSAHLPIPVTVAVWKLTPVGEKELWSGKVELVSEGQEITVVRFVLQNGKMIPGSAHDRFQALRSPR